MRPISQWFSWVSHVYHVWKSPGSDFFWSEVVCCSATLRDNSLATSLTMLGYGLQICSIQWFQWWAPTEHVWNMFFVSVGGFILCPVQLVQPVQLGWQLTLFCCALGSWSCMMQKFFLEPLKQQQFQLPTHIFKVMLEDILYDNIPTVY